MPERYPLSWPTGWKRTAARERSRSSFQQTRWLDQSAGQKTKGSVSMARALARLVGQLRLLDVIEYDAIISTNIPTRLDGLPYANHREPEDPGVAVYFRLKGQDRVLACDVWARVADNVTAIAQHIDALRRIDRYGVGTLEQAFAGYAALPAKGSTWRTTLGFAPDAVVSRDDVERAFRARASEAHPDKQGGSHDAMASLTAARAEAVAELRA